MNCFIYHWRVTSHDVSFTLILWYISKKFPPLQEFNLYPSKSSSNYFHDGIYLVHVILGGIEYCKIHMWYTPGMKSLMILVFVSVTIDFGSNYISQSFKFLFLSHSYYKSFLGFFGCCCTNCCRERVKSIDDIVSDSTY